jgi:hypothetical protein
MNHRKAYLVLTGVILLMLTITVLVKSSQPYSPAQTPDDPKSEIKHKSREARYGTPLYNKSRAQTILLSKQRDGSTNAIDFSFVEIEDFTKPNVLARVQGEGQLERNKLVCSSDVILYGEVLSKTGVITDDDRFIYSVYNFRVGDILRNNSGLKINRDDQIEFTTPGGTAIIGDQKQGITYNYESFKQLKLNDRYIINLKRDAEADDYYVDSPLGIYFLHDGGKAIRMDAEMFPFYARRASILRVPDTMTAVTSDIQSAFCR